MSVIAAAVVLTVCGVSAADQSVLWPDAYDVEWRSPSKDCRDSMPLGNGQVALNTWIEPDGSILFYIARSDAWDEYGRLLKLGKVRINLDPAPETTANFRQRLRLRDATMTAAWGQGQAIATVNLWVDATAPVIHVEAETGLPTTASATIELWRTEPTEIRHLEVSDVLLDRDHPDGKRQPMIAHPDTLLHDWPYGIGWYHHNTESIGPALTARIQGLDDFPRPDPLLNRIFGAALTAKNSRRLSDHKLETPKGRRHHFAIYVHSQYPARPEQWLRTLIDAKEAYEAVPLETYRDRHRRWWGDFWSRSRVMITGPTSPRCVPANQHPIRFGVDQSGGSQLRGELGRVSIWKKALDDADVEWLARTPATQPSPVPDALFTGSPKPGEVLKNSDDVDFSQGMTLEVWVRPEQLPSGGGRLIDKTTPGQNNGFLLDIYPGNKLRCIVGDHILQMADALPDGQWHHVAVTVAPSVGEIKLFRDGLLVARKRFVLDPAFVVSRGYCLQRFITACAGKGPYPIKFNGSLFNVAWPGHEGDADYRRWGPGYWWQNTRLPYYSMCASGDTEFMQPLFQMYARDLVPLFEHRTKKYFNHEGMFIPECIYFWGDVFSETYGWTPFEERGEDKLQTSRWHKWEWVSGLELAWLLLDYYQYTEDETFFRNTALPAIRSVLTFFDRHYRVGNDGKLLLHPAQALETWWDCTNPMPEIAGLHAVTSRLLALPEGLTSPTDRRFWRELQSKLPDLPTRQENGIRLLAPAAQFASKRNIENPELYAVFPFCLVSFEKDNRDLGIEALRRRWDRGPLGWRQDDVFMAYLGLAEDAREYVTARAAQWNDKWRFPAFWGPNYDWVPDQDHGAVLMIAVQSMVMQCDGREIFLLPAWPRDWNVQFRLHAPYRTIVSAEYRNGHLHTLEVTPPQRRADVVLPEWLPHANRSQPESFPGESTENGSTNISQHFPKKVSSLSVPGRIPGHPRLKCYTTFRSVPDTFFPQVLQKEIGMYKRCLGAMATLMAAISMAEEGTLLTKALKQIPPPIDIATGWEIPSEGYCDQPYVVKLPDGTWLCTMTTGKGLEGQRGQHIVSTRSSDRGRTWEPLVAIEPADGPEASWAMPYLTEYGRVYVFYTYNAGNMREVIGGGRRVDTLGEYAFKYSDDGGRTWSTQRWFIPVRETAIDRRNPYQGKVRFFWGVGKPIRHKGAMYLGFSKVGKFGKGFIEESEAWFLRCANIDTQRDPSKLHWETLPEGDHGLKSPEGPIAEEVNLTSLSDGSLFCTYRTVCGHPCHAYSRDDGKTWTEPALMTYGPGGKLVDHPRAANFVRKLTEGPYQGRYLYWFHNHPGKGYEGRNPAYLLGGVEVAGPTGLLIQWGEPVAVLYDKNPKTRISYPDFIWDDGLYITETQKTIARVHQIPDDLLRSLWKDTKVRQPSGRKPKG